MGMGTVSTLTSDDARAIKEECPAVKEVAPIWGGVTQMVYGNQNWNTGVNGTTPAFFDHPGMAHGRRPPFYRTGSKRGG